MRPFRFHWFHLLLWGLVLLSTATAGYEASLRINWEQGYRKVALAVDWQGFEALGATEEIFPTLFELGVRLLSVELGLNSEPGSVEGPVAIGATAAIADGEGSSSGSPRVASFKAAGFEPLYLLWDLHHREPEELADLLHRLEGLAPRVIIFQSEEGPLPLYTPPQLQEIAHFIEEVHPLVGAVEFNPDPDPIASFLRARGFEHFVRVHEIEPDELVKLSLKEALARWERAVRERNVRLLLIHPFPASLDYNLAYLKELAARLREEGFELGFPPEPEGFHLAGWLLFLILLGPVALGILALERGLPQLRHQLGKVKGKLRAWHRWALLGIGIGLIAFGFGLSLKVEVLLRLAIAWGIAASVPLSAYLLVAPWLEGEGQHDANGAVQGGLKRGLGALGGFSGLAILGGVWLGVSLSGVEFFLKLEQFRGVKAALILPLLGVVMLWCARHGLSSLARLLSRKPSLRELALIGLGGLIIVVILLRSENASLIPVLELEERIREGLERLFWARPRFKEFLIGHPLLFLWGARASQLRNWEYGPLILALGLVGQVSIINSFAHLHTPLLISLMRTVGGLLLGGALGLLLLGLVTWGERAWQRLKLNLKLKPKS